MKKLRSIESFAEGDKVQGFYLCVSKHLRYTRTGDLYIDLELRDNTGHISGKIWNNVTELNTSEPIEEPIKETPKSSSETIKASPVA